MRCSRVAALCLFAVALAARPSSGQSWAGGESLEVRVEDPKGKGVAGAEVALAPASGAAGIGFAAVLTDQRGRAAIGGLAAGTWQVEVRQPGFMSYLAEVALGDGKPSVLSAAHRNVPGAKSTLRVRFGRASGAPPLRPIPAAAPEAPPPAAAPEPTVATRSVAEVAVPARPSPPSTPIAPAEKESSRAVTMTSRPAAPVPATPPAPASAPRTPPAVVEAAPPVRPPPPPAAASRPTPPPPAPVAPPPATSLTTPAPLPPPMAPRAEVASEAVVTSCFGCRPGESARALEVSTSAGGEPCPADLRARLEAAPTARWAEIAAALPSGCALLPIYLDAADHYTGFRYEASVPRGRAADCLPGRDCVAGGCRFLGDPLLRQEGGRTIVAAIFESGAERSASFIAYSRPAR